MQLRKKGVLLVSRSSEILWQIQQISYFFTFFFFSLVRKFMKPSNARKNSNTHSLLSVPSPLYQLGNTAQQQMQKQNPKQQHLSARLCLLFTGWLAACCLEIRSWPNTLGLNTDLSCQLCLRMVLNASGNSYTQTSTAGKTFKKH